MSLASSPDRPLRPEDKALKMLFPSADQPIINSFDEIFEREFYEGSDDDPIKREDSEEAADLFAVSLANEERPIHALERHPESSPSQPWRKGLWCLNERPGSQIFIEKTRKAKDASPCNISPAHLVANDNFAMRSPRLITQPYETKSSSPSRLRRVYHHSPRQKQRSSQERETSPSPMYPRSFVNKIGSVDAWQQEFNLQLDDDCLVNAVVPQFAELRDHSFNHFGQEYMASNPVRMGQRSATVHHFGTPDTAEIPQHATHELSSILHANLSATGCNMFPSPPNGNESSFRFVNEKFPGAADWTTESLHSSNSSHNSQFSHNSYESRQMKMYNTMAPQSWWSPSPAHGHNHLAHNPGDNYPALAQPKPRRATHHVLGHDGEHNDVLDVKYPNSEEIGLAIPYCPPELQMPSTGSQYFSQKNVLASYPPLPPPVEFNLPDESPFTTPRRRGNLPSRTPSPSVSPTHRPSRCSQQRSPSRRDASQHRRKSIHKAGPIKGAETPRHRSTSRPPRTPKTPKTPHDSFGQIDFVNFTPKDATKLLSDVAPSGSSKTRARREQEAREKRKKLSEAALAAVRSAGGDVEALERAILT